MSDCSYCRPVTPETVAWRGTHCRVIVASEPGFAGWCRVVWNAHVRELSDLDSPDRNHLMNVVATLERILLEDMRPAKMNVAALGTAAPHLHVHVIPRFADDPTFPDPVWTSRKRDCPRRAAGDFVARLGTALAVALDRAT